MGHSLSSLAALTDYESRINRLLSKCCPKPDFKPWKCMSRRKTDNSYEYAFKIPSGYSYLDIENQLDSLYATCGHNVEIEDRAGIVIIKVYMNDFPDKIPYDPKYLESLKKNEVLIGFNRSMVPIKHDFTIPHIQISGQTGYGKTEFVKWLLYQLISKYPSSELDIYIVDMKGFSFLPFKNISNVHIVDTLDDAESTLAYAREEMNIRKQLIKSTGKRDLTKSFKWILVVIDEASQIAPKLYKDDKDRKTASKCDRYCEDIAAIGREPRISLMYCTQRPDHEIINSRVKANIDSKLSFRVETEINSAIALDRLGAEKLPFRKRGRCLYKTDGLTECQVPFIGDSDTDWENLLKEFYHANQETTETVPTPPHDEGSTDHIDDASLSLLQREWEPDETSVRDAPNPRDCQTHRRTSTGNRKTQNMASYLVWTFPGESKKEGDPPVKQPKN